MTQNGQQLPDRVTGSGLAMDFSYRYDNNGSVNQIYLSGSLLAIWNSTGTIKFQHTDALGSPVAVTNTAGTVIERNDYEPYGAIIGKPTYDGMGFTGHKQDGAAGLTYMQQRYYDPTVGRFLSVDPVTASSGTGDNFNRYKYAANNPYRFVDPDGRKEKNLGSNMIGGNSVARALTTVTASGVGTGENKRAREAAAGNSGQQLTGTITSNTAAGALGTDELTREWSLSRPSKRGGIIVQDVTITVHAFDEDGNQINKVTTVRYWEAWTVLPGRSAPSEGRVNL